MNDEIHLTNKKKKGILRILFSRTGVVILLLVLAILIVLLLISVFSQIISYTLVGALIFNLADFKESDVKDAVEMKWDDFEDAVQAVTASRSGADYIITRNVRYSQWSKVMAVTPSEFLARL